MLLHSIKVALLCTIAACGTGCYNTSSFKSENAQIFHNVWWSPQYVIMFDALTIEDSTTAVFEFRNPPPIELIVCLDFRNKSDLCMMVQHGGRAKVTIQDSIGNTLFEAQGKFEPGIDLLSGEHVWVRTDLGSNIPPPSWSVNSEGMVLKAGYITLPRGAYRETYQIRIEISVDEKLPRPATIHPALEGLQGIYI